MLIVIELKKDIISLDELIENSHKIIERNEHLLKYKDMKLFSHQSGLINIFNGKNNKLNGEEENHVIWFCIKHLRAQEKLCLHWDW